MLDISPEKLMMLMAVGLVVLGPNKLPAAARGLAHGLTRARRLASSLTDPLTTSITAPLTEPLTEVLSEPRQAVIDVVADLRSTIANHPISASSATAAIAPADPSLN